MFGRKKML